MAGATAETRVPLHQAVPPDEGPPVAGRPQRLYGRQKPPPLQAGPAGIRSTGLSLPNLPPLAVCCRRADGHTVLNHLRRRGTMPADATCYS